MDKGEIVKKTPLLVELTKRKGKEKRTKSAKVYLFTKSKAMHKFTCMPKQKGINLQSLH
jgi:hypothetical protein